VRRTEVEVPKQVRFQTKPQIALAQIRQAVENRVSPGVVLADEVYGSGREFRDGMGELKLDYALAVRCTTTVWALERQPLPPKPWRGKGRRATRARRDQRRRPIAVEQWAQELPEKTWREVGWREGSQETLRPRFAA
jgi:SRSO17 transposase